MMCSDHGGRHERLSTSKVLPSETLEFRIARHHELRLQTLLREKRHSPSSAPLHSPHCLIVQFYHSIDCPLPLELLLHAHLLHRRHNSSRTVPTTIPTLSTVRHRCLLGPTPTTTASSTIYQSRLLRMRRERRSGSGSARGFRPPPSHPHSFSSPHNTHSTASFLLVPLPLSPETERQRARV